MEETSIEKLARWVCTLNNWEWPEDLEGKPNGWENFSAILRDNEAFFPNKYHWVGSIIKGIERIIGKKEVLRWHHIHNLDRTNDEFERWWKSEYEN